jgi:hypothetical protein
MQIGETPQSRRLVVALLILLAAGMAGFVLMVPSDSIRFLGMCLITAGAFNMLLHRRFGRQNYRWSQGSPAFIANFWERIGENGTQIIYFGIGIILAAAGSFLLIKSFFRP